MKKLIFLTLSLLILPGACVNFSAASTKSSYYAKIDSENVYFYSLPIPLEEYRLFEIPKSYYVLLTGNENAEFYKASYIDLDGYVLKSQVIPVENDPSFRFASWDLFVDSFEYLKMFNQPEASDEYLVAIPNESTITTYYGKLPGQTYRQNSTNIWYYCSYVQDSQIYRGYLYSRYLESLSDLKPNTESYTPYLEPLFEEEEKEKELSPSGLSPGLKALIVICCTVPCLVIVLLLIRRKSSSGEKKKIIRKSKKDFYEFNEDDI